LLKHPFKELLSFPKAGAKVEVIFIIPKFLNTFYIFLEKFSEPNTKTSNEQPQNGK
jgi:hypothetical protein